LDNQVANVGAVGEDGFFIGKFEGSGDDWRVVKLK